MGGYGNPYSQAYGLQYLIMQAVDEDSWRYSTGRGGLGGTRGGTRGGQFSRPGTTTTGALTEEGEGSIQVYQTNWLIIKQTRRNHMLIARLLEELRETLGEQVSIEARFLAVSNNFLEDIGLDLDLFLNLGNAGFDRTGQVDELTGRQILNPRQNPGPWNRTTPLPMSFGSSDFAVPGQTPLPGSLGGGDTPAAFVVSGSFLDNVQVDFLMRATQAHQRSNSLDAPRVTVFNGESAFVQFYTTQPYVGQMEAVVDNRVGLFEPQIEESNTGVFLTISPTISADKRYVLLYVQVEQNNLLSLDTFTFNVAGGAGLDTAGEETDVPVLSGTTTSTGIIQQPVTQENSVTTRVQVPDGGTLLLGGRKRAAEIAREMGVPALSKIPILNRLFGNNASTKDETVELILIKPKIILPDEEEEKAFGGFEPTSAMQ